MARRRPVAIPPGENKVAEIDPATNTVIGKIAVGRGPSPARRVWRHLGSELRRHAGLPHPS